MGRGVDGGEGTVVWFGSLLPNKPARPLLLPDILQNKNDDDGNPCFGRMCGTRLGYFVHFKITRGSKRN